MLKKEIIVKKSKKILDILQDYGFSFVDSAKILRAKDVKINGKSTKNNDIVLDGDVLTVFYTPQMLKKRYEVVFEGENVLIVWKNSGIETAGEQGLEDVLSAYAVHRLDRNTEGLVMFAKNEKTKEKLENAFKNDKIHKNYLAEVVGECVLPPKIYEAFLVKDENLSLVKIFDKEVKNSVKIKTYIQPEKIGKQTSVLKIGLLTGKTHQIRAHLAHLGYPIVGDGKYGIGEINKKFKQKTQKLACFSLKFDFLGISEIDGKVFEKFPDWYFHNN